MLMTIPKPEHGSQEWLDVRWQNSVGEKRITASVAGAVHGVHPYMTRADLAAELLAPNPPQPKAGTAVTRRGTGMEPWIAQVVEADLGIQLYEPLEMFAYEESGVRLLATIDRRQVFGEIMRVFEIKSWRGFFEGVLKPEWIFQGIQQAICTGMSSIEWAILDSSLTVHHHTQKVSSDEKRYHIEACRQFLAAIDLGMIPDDTSISYGNATTMNPAGVSDKTVRLSVEVGATLERLALAKTQIREAKLVEDLCKGELCALIGDAEIAQLGGRVVATWKTSVKKAFNQAEFKTAHPALYNKYVLESTVRTFRLTKGD